METGEERNSDRTLELREELAQALGWYAITEKNGTLYGKIPGVRSVVSLMIPDWTKDITGLQDILETKYGIQLSLSDMTEREYCERALAILKETL